MRIQRNLAHLPSGGPEGVEFFGLVKFKGAPCNFHIEYLFVTITCSILNLAILLLTCFYCLNLYSSNKRLLQDSYNAMKY